MSFKKLRFFRECQSRAWSFEDIMLGVETAQLSKGLPINLKMLICNMSIGFAVHCLGAREAEFDINGIPNRRDLECLVQKFSFNPSQNEEWTCWPCLDFLKKFNQEVWKQRTGQDFVYNFAKKPLRFRKAPSWMKKKNVEDGNRNPRLSEDVKIAIVIKQRFGEIQISQYVMNNHSPFLRESLESESNMMPRCPHVPKCNPHGIFKLRCC